MHTYRENANALSIADPTVMLLIEGVAFCSAVIACCCLRFDANALMFVVHHVGDKTEHHFSNM